MCDFRIPKTYKGVEYPIYEGPPWVYLEDLNHPEKFPANMFYSVAMTGSMLVFHDGTQFINASHSPDVDFEKDEHGNNKTRF